jgi:hypothetical protein
MLNSHLFDVRRDLTFNFRKTKKFGSSLNRNKSFHFMNKWKSFKKRVFHRLKQWLKIHSKTLNLLLGWKNENFTLKYKKKDPKHLIASENFHKKNQFEIKRLVMLKWNEVVRNELKVLKVSILLNILILKVNRKLSQKIWL